MCNAHIVEVARKNAYYILSNKKNISAQKQYTLGVTSTLRGFLFKLHVSYTEQRVVVRVAKSTKNRAVSLYTITLKKNCAYRISP